MSNIHLLVIKDRKIEKHFINYKDAINLLNNKKVKSFLPDQDYLDAGYLIIDHNQKIIIDNQFAFSQNSIKNKELDSWSWNKIW